MSAPWISCRYCGANDDEQSMVSMQGGPWHCVNFVGCLWRQLAEPFGRWRYVPSPKCKLHGLGTGWLAGRGSAWASNKETE
jgi:hypothetical protein